MSPYDAEQELQTIRTIMERTALYERAVAPVLTWLGAVGIISALLGWYKPVSGAAAFLSYWLCTGAVAVGGAFWLVRNQAMKQGEAFWSPPTRKIVGAMLPGLMVGGLLGAMGYQTDNAWLARVMPMVWMWLYGCALHAASPSLPRGFDYLAWLFIIFGFVEAILSPRIPGHEKVIYGHIAMGTYFGGLHLCAGTLFHFVQKNRSRA